VIVFFSKSSPYDPINSSVGCVALTYESVRYVWIWPSDHIADVRDPVFSRMYRTATWENSTTSVGTLLLVLALVLDVVLLDEAGMEVVVAFAADPVLVALAAAALS
jgi:hypothetical protein